jgi:hypothetical protein
LLPSFTLPPSCLPWLHGRYPASSLLPRLCHLPGTVLRALPAAMNAVPPRLVIPDSSRSNFRPFYLQSPHAFLSLSAHCARQSVGRGFSVLPSRVGFRSGLRHQDAGSPMHQAESSSTLFCLWTGRSLPAALHPASRRRSCLPLPTDQCFCPMRTFTSLLARTLRRTSCQRFAPLRCRRNRERASTARPIFRISRPKIGPARCIG